MFLVTCPPLEEQTEIVGRLEKGIRGLEGLMQESMAAAALLLERRSALISAAVTGQIDVRGLATEEEP
jgi:type I restriction enzyme S subunit